RLIPRHDAFPVVTEQADDGFVALVVRPEEAFHLEGLQIQPIEERTVTFLRRTGAAQIDRVATLLNCGARRTEERGAGIRVGVLLLAIPQLSRLAPRRVQHPRPGRP